MSRDDSMDGGGRLRREHAVEHMDVRSDSINLLDMSREHMDVRSDSISLLDMSRDDSMDVHSDFIEY